jgi:protein TonB
LQEAILMKRVAPTYSSLARQAHIEGTVQVRATIGTDGVPRQLRFVSGDTRLSAPALDAIRLWRYKPAMLDGQAIETEVLVQVEFKLRS